MNLIELKNLCEESLAQMRVLEKNASQKSKKHAVTSAGLGVATIGGGVASGITLSPIAGVIIAGLLACLSYERGAKAFSYNRDRKELQKLIKNYSALLVKINEQLQQQDGCQHIEQCDDVLENLRKCPHPKRKKNKAVDIADNVLRSYTPALKTHQMAVKNNQNQDPSLVVVEPQRVTASV